MNSLRTRIFERWNIKNMIMQLQMLTTSTSENPSPEIQIPMRIERGSTDILRALESTLSVDPTASEYKFMDDPMLIPCTDTKKRSYSLSRESGKRAARWIIKEHGDLIQSEISEPLITAFLPPKNYTNKSEVSNEILMKLIRVGSYETAFHVYNLLEKEVPLETKQALLEVLCYYNSEIHDVSMDFPEEQKYQHKVVMNRNMWMNNPEINNLFEELKNNESTATEAYNAMICGSAKYLSIGKATELHKECVEKNIPITAKSYCYLMQLTPSLKHNFYDCAALIENYLREIISNGIPFDLQILNSILKCMSTIFEKADVRLYVVKVLKKFISFGIQPCLATYYYLLLIFYPNDSRDKMNPQMLQNILNEMSMKEFTIQDPCDTEFFPTAMEIIYNNYFNPILAHKLHEILSYKSNKVFLQKDRNIKSYYRHYHLLILNSDTLKNFQEFYDSFVPHKYIPDQVLLKNIMENFMMNERSFPLLEILSKFLSHIVLFEMLYNNALIKLSLRVLKKYYNTAANPRINNEYSDYVWKIWLHLEVLNKKVKYNVITPASVFGDIINVLLYNNEFEKMMTVLTYFVKTSVVIGGILNKEEFQSLFKQFIKKKQTEAVILLLEYGKEQGLLNDLETNVDNISSQLKLDPEQTMALHFILNSQNHVQENIKIGITNT